MRRWRGRWRTTAGWSAWRRWRRAHGVRGALKLRCFTEAPESVAAYGPLCDERGPRAVRARGSSAPAKGGVIARAEGIDRPRRRRGAARARASTCPRDRLPEPGRGRVLPRGPGRPGRARRRRRARWARSSRVLNFGAGDMLEIAAGGRRAASWCRSPAPPCPRSTSRRPVVVVLPPVPGDAAVTAPWTATVLTLFPEMFPGPLGRLAGRQGAASATCGGCDAVDLRGFAADRHQTVDDTPFGGGAGMVMRPDIVARAVDAAVARGRARAAALSEPARRAACARTACASWPPAPASCCCAAATRASTSA